MAWSAPMTFVANTTLTAAQLNQYLRDNMLETAPAKATTAGYHFVSTGPNQIAERAIVGDRVGTAESTNSTEYIDLTTVGPTVTCETGTKAIYMWSARMHADASSSSMRMAIEVSGATDIEPDISRELQVDLPTTDQNKIGVCHFEDGLTPGTNTFTCKYKMQTSGTGTWGERHLIVIAL